MLSCELIQIEYKTTKLASFCFLSAKLILQNTNVIQIFGFKVSRRLLFGIVEGRRL